jgi:DNA topoisomerase-1
MKPTVLFHKIYKTLCNGYYFIHTSVCIKECGWSDVVEKDWSAYLDNLTFFECKSIHAEEHLSHPEFHLSESQLIRDLEKNQIGRPSTYTHILESIKDKKYVTLGKIHKESRIFTKIVWESSVLTKSENVVELEESNKLTITPLGKEVNDFCYLHFSELFNYTYSKKMEDQLDAIEDGMDPSVLLSESLSKINRMKEVKVTTKSYPTLHAGTYRDHAFVIKDGIYGYYLVYKDQSISLKEFKHLDKIPFWIESQSMPPEHIKDLIEYQVKNENILLVIDADWSLRKGAYGNYLFYKTKSMKKPKFYKRMSIFVMKNNK